MRGLKQTEACPPPEYLTVAPFTGAWIETWSVDLILNDNEVAPFTGAWIETPVWFNVGLYHEVAPFTGAWIETMDKLEAES